MPIFEIRNSENNAAQSLLFILYSIKLMNTCLIQGFETEKCS